MTLGELLGVTALGAVVGVDLVTVPQAMTARPLVAGFLGGWLVGSPTQGLFVGVVLELLALETLPIGAARYPDWGPPAAAAGALVAPGPDHVLPSSPWPWLLSLVLVAAAVAWIGGWAMRAERRICGAAVLRRSAQLDAGDPQVLVWLQAWGFVLDVARAASLTLLALVPGGWLAREMALLWRAPSEVAEFALLAATMGVAAAAVWRLFGRGTTFGWLLAGAGAGIAGLLL